MAYIGNTPTTGDNDSFQILDDLTSYTLTFDGSSTSVVSTASNSFTFSNHRFITGQRVTYTNGTGTDIGGLTDAGIYYIIKVDQNTIKLANSYANAIANSPVPISAVGTGSDHTINVAFDNVNTKFKATYGDGKKAKVTRPAQLTISINGVIQQPVNSPAPATGYGLDADSTIVFSSAPAPTDTFFGSVIAKNNPTFDISDNTIDNFTGDGIETQFTLSKFPANGQNILVTLDGVVQYPSDTVTRSYSVNANVLIFTSAPGNGVVIQVRHIGFAGATSSNVTGFYGRTGNVGLNTTDNIEVLTAKIGTGTTFTEDLVVQGDARITGILTIGTGSITFDGSTNTVSGITTAYISSINGNNFPSDGPLSNRNRIINGDMRIDQRNAGASVTPGAATFNYYLDRWAFGSSQASKVSIQQNAGSVTPPAGFTHYLGVTSLSAYSVVASDYFWLYQKIEGFNTADLDWSKASAKTITLSFWVRSSLTGTFSGSIQNSDINRTYPFSYVINSSNTWEYKTISIPGDTSGTWLTNNSTGIQVNLSVAAGSNNLGTAGAWVGTSYIGATGSTSLVGTNGATFYITGVQLEAGDTATPFEHRNFSDELARCQRYYEKSFDIGTTPANGSNGTSFATRSGLTILLAPHRGTFEANDYAGPVTHHYTVEKRASPALTMYGNSTSDWYRIGVGWGTQANLGLSPTSTKGFVVRNDFDGSATPPPVMGHWAADAEL